MYPRSLNVSFSVRNFNSPSFSTPIHHFNPSFFSTPIRRNSRPRTQTRVSSLVIAETYYESYSDNPRDGTTVVLEQEISARSEVFTLRKKDGFKKSGNPRDVTAGFLEQEILDGSQALAVRKDNGFKKRQNSRYKHKGFRKSKDATYEGKKQYSKDLSGKNKYGWVKDHWNDRYQADFDDKKGNPFLNKLVQAPNPVRIADRSTVWELDDDDDVVMTDAPPIEIEPTEIVDVEMVDVF